MVRAATRARMDEVLELVRNCFEAGALATGASVDVSLDVAYSDMRHDHELASLYRRQAEALGRTFSDEPAMPVSTDMGNVSHVVPSIHPFIGIETQGAVNHQAELREPPARDHRPTRPSSTGRWRSRSRSSRRPATSASGRRLLARTAAPT